MFWPAYLHNCNSYPVKTVSSYQTPAQFRMLRCFAWLSVQMRVMVILLSTHGRRYSVYSFTHWICMGIDIWVTVYFGILPFLGRYIGCKSSETYQIWLLKTKCIRVLQWTFKYPHMMLNMADAFHISNNIIIVFFITQASHPALKQSVVHPLTQPAGLLSACALCPTLSMLSKHGDTTSCGLLYCFNGFF